MTKSIAELMTEMQAAISAIDPEALAELGKVRARFELLAKEYEATSGVLRRRAASQPDPERAGEQAESGERFRRRAAIMRAAAAAPATIVPAVARMPRELRTPAESLDLVDDFRRDLAALVASYADMGADELAAFGEALPPADASGLQADWQTLAEELEALAAWLGCRPGEEPLRFRDPRIFPPPEPSNEQMGGDRVNGPAPDPSKGATDHAESTK